MADVAISNPNAYENLHAWKELERSVKAMQEYHATAPAYEAQLYGCVSNGASTDNIADNELEVLMEDLKKDDPDYDVKVVEAVSKDNDTCVREMLKFFKDQIASAIHERAPDSVNAYLKAEEHKFDEPIEPKEGSNSKEEERGFWGRLWDSVKSFFNGLMETLKNFWNVILDILRQVIDFVKKSITNLFDRVGEMLLKVYTTAEEAAGKQVKIVTELLLNQIEQVLKSYSTAFLHGLMKK